MKEHISILRKDIQDDLYTQLQEKSVKIVQQLSGEIWTDFNEHDPGVTTLQALNYSLLEMDYRLQFDTEDYIASPDNSFNPQLNTLFLPEKVFPVNPVTEMDYRKLFLSSIDNLVNVWPVIHNEEGKYDFIVDVSPGTTVERRTEIRKEIYQLYHIHRNLCENMGEIRFLEHKNVSVHLEIDVAGDYINIEALIARIYIEIQEFLASGVRFKKLEELMAAGITMDQILEGPYQKRMVIDEDSLLIEKKDYNFLLLYNQLQKLPGVHDIISFSLTIDGMELDKYIRSLSQGNQLISYVVNLPTRSDEQTVFLKKRGKPLSPSWELVGRLHHIMYLQMYGAQNDATDTELLRQIPPAVYRNLYNHYPVKDDFPVCYAKAYSLHHYLSIFDNLILDGLEELKSFPTIMQLEENSLSERKEQWLDMLDAMYGEHSNPDFFVDPESKTENRLRRNRFLKDVSIWGYVRGRAINILESDGKNLSGVEAYMRSIFSSENHALEIYLLEHQLFGRTAQANSFTVTVVLSANKDCMNDSEFTNNCEQLLLNRIPAHIRTVIYWLDENKLRSFSNDYRFWRYLLSTEEKIGLKELSDKINNSWHMISIDKLIFNLTAGNEEFARNINRRWESFYQPVFEQVAGEVMSVHNSDNETYIIENLALDLGVIPEEEFDRLYPERLRESLQAWFGRMEVSFADALNTNGVRKISLRQNKYEILVFFLLHGYMLATAGNEPITLSELLNDVLRNSSALLREFLEKYAHYDFLHRRLAMQFTDDDLENLVARCRPSEGKFINLYVRVQLNAYKNNPVRDVSFPDYRNAVWILVLAYSFTETGSRFNRKQLILYTLRGLAARFNLSFISLTRLITDNVQQLEKMVGQMPEFWSIMKEIRQDIHTDIMKTYADYFFFALREIVFSLRFQRTNNRYVLSPDNLGILLSVPESCRKLLYQLNEVEIYRLVEIVVPSESQFVISYSQLLDKHNNKDSFSGKAGSEFRLLKWEFIFQVIYQAPQILF